MEIKNQTSDQPEIIWSQEKWGWFFAIKACPDIQKIGKMIDPDLPAEDLNSREAYFIRQHLSCCELCDNDFFEIMGGSQMSYARQIREYRRRTKSKTTKINAKI